MTFWEQLDDGVQNTSNRKVLTLVPVVLFLLATHGTDYRWKPSLLMALVSCPDPMKPLQAVTVRRLHRHCSHSWEFLPRSGW